MKLNCFILLAMSCACVQANPATPNSLANPVRFEPLSGRPGRFIARGLPKQVMLESNRATVQANGRKASLRFEGTDRAAQLTGTSKLPSITNRFIGRDSTKWECNVPNYSELRAPGLYPGIDVVYYSTNQELEYDLAVHPGADPAKIRLRFDGPAFNTKPPLAYQWDAQGNRVTVASAYRKNADGTLGFQLGRYDKRRELIIDPVLSLSSYIGGSGADVVKAIGHDANGLIYLAGTTTSTDFFTSDDAYAGSNSGVADIFILTIDPKAGPQGQILYSTYFGGSGSETVNDMVVTGSGLVYVTGSTNSSDIPLANAAQATLNGTSDAYVLELVPSQGGSAALFYASYLGGTTDETAYGIAVAPGGRIYVTGSTTSSDFPVVGATQSVLVAGMDAFISVIDTSKSNTGTLIYSSYFGGSGQDVGRGITAAPDGTMWVVGSTFSADFPTAGYSVQPNYTPGGDAFVAQIDPGSAAVLYCSYLGGSAEDQAKRVRIDATGRVVIAGYTSSYDFPVTPNAFQPQYGGGTDAFIAILDTRVQSSSRSAQLIYSSFYGGSQGEAAVDLKLDSLGYIYLTGNTQSPDLPVTANALQSKSDNNLDGFALRFDPTQPGAGAVQYSSYVGGTGTQNLYGIDFNATGQLIYVAGSTTGSVFLPYSGGDVKLSAPGNTDGFVMGVTPCSIDTSLRSEQFSVGGGSDTITVNASTGCKWNTISQLDWVTLNPPAGIGKGTVQITVAANTTGVARKGTVSIAGIAFAVGQDGN